jgi:hypothetical protein
MICSSRTPAPLSRQQARPATHKKTEKERQLAEGKGMGKGVGEEPNDTTARKLGIQYSLMNAQYVGKSKIFVQRFRTYVPILS